jgi:uncharacterized protein YjbJ (UPF0337 family)
VHERSPPARRPPQEFPREDINKRSDDTDKDRIAGAAKESKGAIKEAAGKVLGDAKLTADGKSDKAEGKVQNAIGSVNDAVRHALKK